MAGAKGRPEDHRQSRRLWEAPDLCVLMWSCAVGLGGNRIQHPVRSVPVRQRHVACASARRSRRGGRDSAGAARRASITCAGGSAIIGSSGAARSASSSLIIFELGPFDPGDHAQRDLLADQLSNRSDGSAVFGCRQHERPAAPAGTSGPADAVDIVLGVDRHVEAEDVAHALDIQAAGRDVAGDQQADLAFAEALQGLCPLRLRHVAMQRRGIEAVPSERARQDIDVSFAVAEDQCVLDVFGSDQIGAALRACLPVG